MYFLVVGLVCVSQGGKATVSKLNDCKLLSFPPPSSESIGHLKVLKVSARFLARAK